MSQEYANQNFKEPVENADYGSCSDFIITKINNVLEYAVSNGLNKIVINTNLRCGLPMENINKIAGPMVESWACELFSSISKDHENEYKLINVEAQERLCMSDIILQFKKQSSLGSALTANIDVKATSEDIVNSGKSPNITSYARIRTAYIEDPNYIFIILSLKHKAFSIRNPQTQMMDSIMEIIGYKSYDLKFISEPDISYNPALGTGQIQIRDIHYVSIERRTAWEFCQLLDKKYLNSSKRSFEAWHQQAQKNGWIK